MAERRTSLNMWKGSIILSFVLLNISVRLYTICKCRHPLNYATGVSLWPLTKEERGSMTYD